MNDNETNDWYNAVKRRAVQPVRVEQPISFCKHELGRSISDGGKTERCIICWEKLNDLTDDITSGTL